MPTFDPVETPKPEWSPLDPIKAEGGFILPPAGAITNDHLSGGISPTKLAGIGAKVYRSTTQAVDSLIANGEMVSFDTVVFDEGGLWSATAPTRLTFPFAGVYQISGYIKWEGDADGYRLGRLVVNGTTELVTLSNNSVGAGTATQVFVSTAYAASAGQYVELFGGHTAGNSLNIQSGQDSNFLVATFSFPI